MLAAGGAVFLAVRANGGTMAPVAGATAPAGTPVVQKSDALLHVLVALAAVVALTSMQGRALWKFVQGARVELSKVVWPTKDETIQTTLVVLVVAVIGGVLFWVLDFFLLWITTRITGQGSF